MTTDPGGERLLTRVRHVARTRHLSPRTEKAYRAWIVRFVRFSDLRQSLMVDESEVRRSRMVGKRATFAVIVGAVISHWFNSRR